MLLRSSAAALLFLAAAPLACATSGPPSRECAAAHERLVNECGFDVDGFESLDANCTGSSLCLALCFEEAPCADILKKEGEFSACAAQCQ